MISYRPGGLRGGGSSGDDQVDGEVHQLGREIKEPLGAAIGRAILDPQILPFDITAVSKAAQQRVQIALVPVGRNGLENADPVDPRGLRVRGKAPAKAQPNSDAGKNVPAPQ